MELEENSFTIPKGFFWDDFACVETGAYLEIMREQDQIRRYNSGNVPDHVAHCGDASRIVGGYVECHGRFTPATQGDRAGSDAEQNYDGSVVAATGFTLSDIIVMIIREIMGNFKESGAGLS